MSIISENRQINKSFQLSFKLHNAVGCEFLDYDLPFPNTVIHGNRETVYYTWLINGYFGTNASKDYLNDIIARFLISFKEYKPQRLAYKQKTIQNDTLHELKEFQNLESIKKRAYDISRSESVSYSKDMVFYAIKFYAEQLIVDYGVCDYDRIESFAFENFISKAKDKSTLKAKCRSITNWYIERNYELSTYQRKMTDKEYLMTRQENCKRQNEIKAEKNRRLVINAITGAMKDTYKKKNGKWNISKLAKDLKLNRQTVMKYIQD